MERVKEFLAGEKIVLLICAVIIAFFTYQLKDIVLLFFASFVIASAINPLVDIFNKKMSRGMAVLVVYFIGFILSAVCILPLGDVLIRQTNQFIKDIPVLQSHFNSLIAQITSFGKSMGFSLDFNQVTSSATVVGGDIVNRSINFTVNFFSSLVIVFTLAMIVLYMLLDKEPLKHGYLSFFPKNIRAKAEEISGTISKKVGGYVIGQVVSMIAVAVLVWLGLFIAGVNFSLLLGMIAGILDIIPVVGPFIALSIAILVAVAEKPILVVWAIVVYSIAQWVTNTFLRPYIFSKFLDIHPLIVILALLVSAAYLGVVGVILSPAIAATVCVLIEELYLKKINS